MTYIPTFFLLFLFIFLICLHCVSFFFSFFLNIGRCLLRVRVCVDVCICVCVSVCANLRLGLGLNTPTDWGRRSSRKGVAQAAALGGHGSVLRRGHGVNGSRSHGGAHHSRAGMVGGQEECGRRLPTGLEEVHSPGLGSRREPRDRRWSAIMACGGAPPLWQTSLLAAFCICICILTSATVTAQQDTESIASTFFSGMPRRKPTLPCLLKSIKMSHWMRIVFTAYLRSEPPREGFRGVL